MNQKTKDILLKIFVAVVIVLIAIACFVVQERQRIAEIEAEKARYNELYQELLSEYEKMYSLPLVDVDEIIDKTGALGTSDYADEADKIEEEALEYLEFVHKIWRDYTDITSLNYNYVDRSMLENLAIVTLARDYSFIPERITHYYDLYEEYISDKGDYSLTYFKYGNDVAGDYEHYQPINRITDNEKHKALFECAKDSIMRNLDSQYSVDFFKDEGYRGLKYDDCDFVYERGTGKYTIFGECYINGEFRCYIVTLDFDGEYYSNDSIFYYDIWGDMITSE